VDDIPRITVISDPDGNFFCLNNRRLYVFKEVGKLGLLEGRTPRNTISVRLKPAVPREQKKYSTATCSLKCALMREKGHSSLDNADDTNEAELSDHDNDDPVGKSGGDDRAEPLPLETSFPPPPPPPPSSSSDPSLTASPAAEATAMEG
jgi:hypothetical protein